MHPENIPVVCLKLFFIGLAFIVVLAVIAKTVESFYVKKDEKIHREKE